MRAVHGGRFRIEVEARDLNEVAEALSSGVDRIMLDNMSVGLIRKAAEMAGGRVELEVSGNVTQKNLQRSGAFKSTSYPSDTSHIRRATPISPSDSVCTHRVRTDRDRGAVLALNKSS